MKGSQQNCVVERLLKSLSHRYVIKWKKNSNKFMRSLTKVSHKRSVLKSLVKHSWHVYHFSSHTYWVTHICDFNNVTRYNTIETICTYKNETVNELFIKSTGTSMADIQSPTRSLSVNIKIELFFIVSFVCCVSELTICEVISYFF